MVDRPARRLRRAAAAARREAALARAAVRAYNRLFKEIEPLLAGSRYSPDVLDNRLPAWRDAVDEELAPEVSATYIAALLEDAREGVTIDAQPYAAAYLGTVDNRLVGVADHAFDLMRTELRQGVLEGESIPELAKRIDGLLSDGQRWRNRATVIARTEVVGANNAGAYDAAAATADQLGVAHAVVVKEWLSTPGERTRHTHREADGQQVLGLEARFEVGLAHLLRPGEAGGPPEEVIQCRCSTLYHFPGDLDYPENLTAGGTMPTLERLAQLFDVSALPPELQAYWLGPEGAAKIGYGTPGQFGRCQVALKGKVPGRMIDGTCANLIHKATGQWPGGHKATGTTTAYAVDAENPMVEPPPGAVPADAEPAEQGEPNTTAVVVALPAATDTVHGIGPEEKHATLLFFGETATLEDGAEAIIKSVLDIAAGRWAPFTTAVTSLGELGPADGDKAMVWLLEDDELPKLRSDLLDTDSELERLLENAEQFPTYTPHTTVGYPGSQDDDAADEAWPTIEAAAGDVATITYDRLALWWNDEHTEYPLAGDTPLSDTSQAVEDDAAMSAAATEAPAGPAETATDLTWTGVLAPEGVTTGDKRKFAAGSIVWLNTPAVLKAMFADKPGHDESVPVGLILGIERDAAGLLQAHGTWDISENAVEARRQNIAGLLRGVSVDLDDTEISFEMPDGTPIEGDELWDLALDEEPTLVIDKGRIRAATLWCTPAFVEAYVLDSTVADEVPDTSVADAASTPLAVAASALYAAATKPAATAAPAAAFADPGLTEPTCLTVTPEGRVFGHLATWGTCHIGIDGACVTPPNSQTDYAYFATGMYQTADGEVLPVGAITMGTGHADLALGWRPTADHYDDTGTAAAYINIGEDGIGIWFAGVLSELLPKAQREALARTGSISGDWRGIGGNLELVAALAVNVPGFPIPRVASRVASAAGGAMALVASGMVKRPILTAAGQLSVPELAREVAAYQTRQARRDLTVRRLRKQRQAALAGRITRG